MRGRSAPPPSPSPSQTPPSHGSTPNQSNIIQLDGNYSLFSSGVEQTRIYEREKRNLSLLSVNCCNKSESRSHSLRSTTYHYMPQLDGNVSPDSSLLSSVDEEEHFYRNEKEYPQTIPLIIGNRPHKEHKEERKQTLRVIRRNNRGQTAIYLPNIAVYNHRSIWKKFKNFVTESKELRLGI